MSFTMQSELHVMRTVHDGDCPKCGYPETTIVRDMATMTPLWEECGSVGVRKNKKHCDWGRKMYFRDPVRLQIKRGL